MTESQTEIKKIKAELRSMQVQKPVQRPSSQHSQTQRPQAQRPAQSTKAAVTAAIGASDRTHSGRYPEIELPPIVDQRSHQRLQGFPEQGFSDRADEAIDAVDWQPAQSIQISSEPLADRVNRLQQKSIQQLQQLAQSTPAQVEIALQQLEEQADQINQLSATQEAAILALKAIAERIEQEWKARDVENAARAGYDASTVEIPPLCEYQPVSLPQIEKNKAGVLVVTSRSVDLFKAEREAALTAQALRHLKPPHLRSRSSWTRQFKQWVLGAGQPAKPQTAAQIRRRKSQGFSRREGMTLLVGAVLVRVLLNLLLSTHPGLWFPAVALIVTPGAIALYRAKVTPRSSLSWGYRLLAIMLGLWIGGRLPL